MRAVVQRVKKASVTVSGQRVSSIGPGVVVFLGVGRKDTLLDLGYLAEKVAGLRIFEDEQGKMNRSLMDTGGEILCVSQFTLHGDCRKGKRPSFTEAALPTMAKKFYQEFCILLEKKGLPVKRGLFGAEMQVKISNDGPVTILLDSGKQF